MRRVSIGIPVYNGAKYLETALSAVLAQDYENLEVVISDNASTDETPLICQMYSGDDRVRYHRQDTNQGALANFVRVFDLTSGDFFCWAAHDDRMLPGFIRKGMESLADNPDAAMCITSIRFIDANGDLVGRLHEGQGLASPEPGVRFQCFLERHHWFTIYGLYRRDVLAASGLVERVAGTDVLLLWRILLRYRLCVVEEELFEYRTFLGAGKSAHLASNLAPSSDSRRWWRFLAIRLWREMWKATQDDEIPHETAHVARKELRRWLLTPYWRTLVYNDLAGEVAMALRSRRWPTAVCAALAMGLLRPIRSITYLMNRRVIVAQLRNAARGNPAEGC